MARQAGLYNPEIKGVLYPEEEEEEEEEEEVNLGWWVGMLLTKDERYLQAFEMAVVVVVVVMVVVVVAA